MDVSHYPDALIVIGVLALWVIFPVAMIISMSHVDKDTDQDIQLDHLRHYSEEPTNPKKYFKAYGKHLSDSGPRA